MALPNTPNTTQARDALAWVTQDQDKAQDPDVDVSEWLWQAIQGDFNENRSTGQIAFDAALSMIPLVDQICDVRDLVANSRKIANDPKDQWAWVALALTLIGLFPTLGSLVKGVLKIFFTFVRKYGIDHVAKAIEPAMTWIITFLRRKDVQAHLRKVLKWDDVFLELSQSIRKIRGMVSAAELLKAFDKGIKVMEGLLKKVTWLPRVGKQAQGAVDMVKKVRAQADEFIGKAVAPIQKVLDDLIQALERERLATQRGVLNANNVHFRGTLPQSHAVRLMNDAEPPPSWLSKGVKQNQEIAKDFWSDITYTKAIATGWPELTEKNIKSFAKGTIRAAEVKGPARLYRILSPSSRGMSDCWVSKEVFDKINGQADPRTYWRKFLAVWPNWNSNGQFVVYDIKAGESLKVWRGATSAQQLDGLKGKYLEGGDEQIVFNLPRGHAHHDTMRYYQLGGGHGNQLRKPLSEKEYQALSKDQREKYSSIREQINHPSISGPFETGWAPTDYDAALPDRIGLPSLPGQITQLAK